MNGTRYRRIYFLLFLAPLIFTFLLIYPVYCQESVPNIDHLIKIIRGEDPEDPEK